MTAVLAVNHPSNVGGVMVVVFSVIISTGTTVMLYGWDDPQRTQSDRDRDIMKGPMG